MVVMAHPMPIVAVAIVASLVAALWPRVAYRLAVPAGEPPRYGCPRCSRRFRPGWRGWLRLGRPCRVCPAGPWWAASGLAALAAGALTWRAHATSLDQGMLVLAWLLVMENGVLLAMIDIAAHRLPTPLVRTMTVGVATCIAVAALTAHQPRWAADAALAAVVLGGGYLLLALLTPNQVGMGDVRLAAVLGAALGTGGWDAVLLGAILPYPLALPFAVSRLTRRGAPAGGQLPFGPFLVAGAVLAAIVAAF
jgi:leader peptidase (prepilin peptidase)/N-methyltransferase